MNDVSETEETITKKKTKIYWWHLKENMKIIHAQLFP